MYATQPFLAATDFPALGRGRVDTLQVNPGCKCKLTILSEPGQQDLAAFLAAEGVEVAASLPCRSVANVERQRGYVQLLKAAYQPQNLGTVMCRSLVSVDWQGELYDCDFNQRLGLPARVGPGLRPHLRDLLAHDGEGEAIRAADHCCGCTAGQGSSCGGALAAA